MSADWKPGDVFTDDRGQRLYKIEVSENTRTAWRSGACLVSPEGNGSQEIHHPGLRPLVVIDPEDDGQVGRLADAFCYARWSHIEGSDECDPLTRSSMRTALREYASPTPPKPEEPQGLGAVVEDAEGADWHRTRDGRWIAEDGLRSRAAGWVHIDAVRVLSEGVTA